MGNIVGIGTDLVHIPRIEQIYARFGARFADRILHPDERTEFNQSKQPVSFLAKRFAAKEALAKALGTGIAHGVQFHDFIIRKDARGQPQVTLEGGAKRHAAQHPVTAVHLSISDEREYALAFVVLS